MYYSLYNHSKDNVVLMLLWFQVSAGWQAFLGLSLCLQLLSLGLIFYWSRRRWSNHPISRTLQVHTGPQWAGWGAVATSINTEFRRIDKFASGAPGARVIVTETWVIKVDTVPLWSFSVRSSGGRQKSIIYFLIMLSRCAFKW